MREISTTKSNLYNKTLASMFRNVILSMTDVVHLARQRLLLVLFTYFWQQRQQFYFYELHPHPILVGEKLPRTSCFCCMYYA